MKRAVRLLLQGRPEAVTNGAFTSDTGWTKSGSVTWSAGQYVIADVAGTDAYISQQLTGVPAGRTIRVSIAISANTTTPLTGMRVRQGTAAGGATYGDTFPPSISFTGVWTFHIVAGQDNPWLTLLVSSLDTAATVTSFSSR